MSLSVLGFGLSFAFVRKRAVAGLSLLGLFMGPFVLGDWGDGGAGGPPVHMLMESLRKSRLVINVTAPRLALLKIAALCL